MTTIALDLGIEVDIETNSAVVAGATITADSARELERKLGRSIYYRLHARATEPDTSSFSHIRDRLMERRISAALDHPAVEVTPGDQQRLGGRRTGTLLGVRVILPDDAGETISVSRQWPARSPGYYYVTGRQKPPAGSIWRVYVAVGDADAAPAEFAEIVAGIDASGVPWDAKVLSLADQFPRSDAITIYTDTYESALEISRIAAGTVHPDLCSAFTNRTAAGVAIAEEPADSDPARKGLSFGQHRATIVAAAGITQAREGGDFAEILAGLWDEAGVDRFAFWRNNPKS
ncbi:T3SS effector HopA1 family protein [Nocardia sp. CA-290969]|uniref:T3SS effector HopA1 family protein n=1 Tax=Nocardia sp. CA-290969 TaxID=3239986 RepID=UPI003D8B9FA9